MIDIALSFPLLSEYTGPNYWRNNKALDITYLWILYLDDKHYMWLKYPSEQGDSGFPFPYKKHHV